MTKLKRVLKVVYIVICITIATVVLNKIFANTNVSENIITGATKFGWYKLKIEEEEIAKISWDPSELIDLTDESNPKLNRAVYMDDLDEQFAIFCIQENMPMPHRDEYIDDDSTREGYEGGIIYQVSKSDIQANGGLYRRTFFNCL